MKILTAVVATLWFFALTTPTLAVRGRSGGQRRGPPEGRPKGPREGRPKGPPEGRPKGTPKRSSCSEPGPVTDNGVVPFCDPGPREVGCEAIKDLCGLPDDAVQFQLKNAEEYEIDWPVSDATLWIFIRPTGTVSWISGSNVYAVMAKEKAGTNVYCYPNGERYDANLAGPTGDQKVKSITWCHSPDCIPSPDECPCWPCGWQNNLAGCGHEDDVDPDPDKVYRVKFTENPGWPIYPTATVWEDDEFCSVSIEGGLSCSNSRTSTISLTEDEYGRCLAELLYFAYDVVDGPFFGDAEPEDFPCAVSPYDDLGAVRGVGFECQGGDTGLWSWKGFGLGEEIEYHLDPDVPSCTTREDGAEVLFAAPLDDAEVEAGLDLIAEQCVSLAGDLLEPFYDYLF